MCARRERVFSHQSPVISPGLQSISLSHQSCPQHWSYPALVPILVDLLRAATFWSVFRIAISVIGVRIEIPAGERTGDCRFRATSRSMGTSAGQRGGPRRLGAVGIELRIVTLDRGLPTETVDW